MAKELLEIKQFQTGTITTPSETDIPLDAASYSLNIDPISENGRLEGVPDDMVLDTDKTFKDSSSSIEDFTFKKAAIINDSGVDNLIAYNHDANTFHKIQGFVDGATANTNRDAPVGDAIVSSADEVTMQKNNKEVHIGTGYGATDKPKWCGMVSHSQFGTAASGLQLEDAELIEPGNFPDFYKIVVNADNTYIYGIEWQGQNVFKFDVVNSRMVKKSSKIFNKLQGLCLASDGHLWTIDIEADDSIHLIKIDNEDLLDIVDVAVTGPAYATISDIIEIGSYIWFSNSGATTTKNFLWNMTVATFVAGAGTTALTNRSTFMGTSGVSDAIGDWTDNDVTPDEETVGFLLPKVALVKVNNNDKCGFASKVYSTSGGVDSKSHYTSGLPAADNQVECRYILQMVRYDITSGDKIDGTNNKLLRIGLADVDYDELFNVGVGEDFTVSYKPSGTTTDIFKYAKPEFSHTNATVMTSGGVVESALDVSNASVISVSDSGTQYHAFQGSGYGRWVYGAATALVPKLEPDVDIAFSDQAGAFSATHSHKFWYKVSYLYDGYQESPLSVNYLAASGGTNYPDGADRVIKLTISIRNLASISNRVSHINVYRSSSSVVADTEPLGFYRLVGSYKLNDSWTDNADGGGGNPAWSNYRKKEIIDNGNSGASYEALNGISETLKNTLPNYALSTQLNNIHFIAKCYHPDLDDASAYLFKSQPYNFDQFDWSLDLLRLPTIPTALASFQGRVYAFDENNTYRIEPNNLFIEDTFEGIGCHGPDAVIVTEYGMFFADKRNIYMHNGTSPVPIGTSIVRNVSGTSTGWHANKIGSDTRLIFDAERSSVLVSFSTQNDYTPYYFWSYNVTFRRWDLIHVDTSYAVEGHFTGRDGSIYLSKFDKLYYFMGSTSKRAWNWTSKQITAGQDTQVKKFKKFRITGSPSGTLGNTSTGVSCSIDGSAVTETGTTSEWKVDSQNGNYCQVALNGQTSDVDAIGIIFRRKPVK